MPDLKAHYERYLLAAAGLATVFAGIMLLLSAGSAKEASQAPSGGGERKPFVAAPEVATLKSDCSAMGSKPSLRESTNGASPFVSRIYLLNEGRLVDLSGAGNDLFKDIPNAWILENKLALDRRLPERDPDSDGFSNLEEFAAKTNPNDAASKPAEWSKLRLTEVKIEQMKIMFTGRDFKGRAVINSIAATSEKLATEPSGPTKYYAPGETLTVATFKPGYAVTYDEEKTPFRLGGFRTDRRENPSITVEGKPKMDEVDFAVLESVSGDGTKVELEANKAQTSPYSLASLLDTRPGGTSVSVRIGEPFALGSDARYKLVDVSEEQATIEDLATNERHTVPRTETVSQPQATPAEAPAP